ncbi:MAG: hypothetical protein WCK76_05825 [Elusimicrobiota bacterium]
MKKPVIISVVGLLAVLLFLQYTQRKNAVPSGPDLPMPGQAAPAQPGGVPLPADAASYSAMSAQPAASGAEPAQFVRPLMQGGFTPPPVMAGKGPIPAILSNFANAPVCRDGKSLNDILSSHGRLWGYSATGPEAFYKNENDAVYALLAKYFSCQAVAADNPDMCNFLPGAQSGKENYFHSPNYQCVGPSTRVLFFAYAAGKYKSEQPCRKYLAGDNVSGASVPPEFCREAAKGFAWVCDKAGSSKARCRMAFPSSRDDCKNPECVENFQLYSALQDGSRAGCPKAYAGECGAFFSKSPAGCAGVLEKLGETYCQSLSNHLSSAERTSIDETNKKVREILKKR